MAKNIIGILLACTFSFSSITELSAAEDLAPRVAASIEQTAKMVPDEGALFWVKRRLFSCFGFPYECTKIAYPLHHSWYGEKLKKRKILHAFVADEGLFQDLARAAGFTSEQMPVFQVSSGSVQIKNFYYEHIPEEGAPCVMLFSFVYGTDLRELDGEVISRKVPLSKRKILKAYKAGPSVGGSKRALGLTLDFRVHADRGKVAHYQIKNPQAHLIQSWHYNPVPTPARRRSSVLGANPSHVSLEQEAKALTPVG